MKIVIISLLAVVAASLLTISGLMIRDRQEKDQARREYEAFLRQEAEKKKIQDEYAARAARERAESFRRAGY
ncbi:MAG: hypothetical protein SFY92_00705 [Verrucomicrobiae bacterium]|nr:hypothetical protein [Verrucomicrobiae bacterium]